MKKAAAFAAAFIWRSGRDTLTKSLKPSSCRAGNCRTCLSNVLQGEVRYEMAWPGITPDEKAQGCVLPCVAYPVTDVVLKDPFED